MATRIGRTDTLNTTLTLGGYEGAADGARAPSLAVVAFHYVRDLTRTRFPRLKAQTLDRFHDQLRFLRDHYEMATLETSLEFLQGTYRPARTLCLLTFDDGLKEHHADICPLLVDAGVQGLFFPATMCLEGRVASVHKVHFLMAGLEFSDYRRAFLRRLDDLGPAIEVEPTDLQVRLAYPWDLPEVGRLKYLANFTLPPELRDRILDDLFADHLGPEQPFARELYLSWDDLRQMQSAGMIVGGHSDRHAALSDLPDEEQQLDLSSSLAMLKSNLRPQPFWPFAYPYGRHAPSTSALLARLGFACAFTVEPGHNFAGHDVFALRRFDTNQVRMECAA
jgi:peptidoglycan/xylan/chitin deacetylase (PgdA/CDA1 family)